MIDFRLLGALCTLLRLAVVSSLIVALPARGFQAKQRTVPEIVERILEGRKMTSTGQRYGASGDLVRIETDEARRASLELLETEDNAYLRGRFLAHAAGLAGLEDRMRRELDDASNATCAETAAAYLLAHEARGRARLSEIFDAATGTKRNVQQQAVLLALASSDAAEDHALFSKKCASLKSAELARVFTRFRDVKGPHIDEVRHKALKDSYAPLRGAALEQLCANGDAEALQLARELADANKPDAAMLRFVALSLFARPTIEDLPRIARIVEGSAVGNTSWKYQLDKLAKEPFVEAWATNGGVQDKDPAVRAFACGLLERFESEAASDALFALTQSKQPELRRRAILALAKRKDMRVSDALEKAFAKGDLELRIDALEGLALLHGDEAAFHERLLDLASSGKTPLRLVALGLGAERQLTKLLDMLPELLASKDWRLRVAGIQLARDVRAKSSIPQLIDCLENEDGRLAEDAREALASLTRLYYQRAKDWKRWWEREGERFELPPPEKKDDDKDRIRDGARRPDASAGLTSASFYGIPVLSDRVVYCIDMSGSMNAKIGTGITRLEVAQGALVSALKASPKKSVVNVVFFEDGVHPYGKKSVRIDNKAKLADIEKFARRFKPRGGTNIHGALVAAMEDPDVDTIFLLSDGAPSSGEITDPKLLVDDILRRNRSRRIVFHCISIGSNSAMLRRLAEETGGKFTQQ